MANELQFQLLQDETVYAVVRDASTGQVCTPADGEFTAWSAFNDHKIALVVDGGLLAVGDMPADVDAGYYYAVCYNSDGTQIRSVQETKYWSGTEWLEEGEDFQPGDYAVTLTIRTTGGTPLAGVTVWLNVTDTRGATVVLPATTNDAGAVVFNLHYSVAYYIFCHLAGYDFADASMTPAAGSVTFTKDIATATTVTTPDSEAFLARAIATVRLHLDEPDVDAKYSDAELIGRIEQSYPLILGEINRSSRTPIVAKATITVVDGTYKYALPPTIGNIWAIYTEDTNGCRVFYHSLGHLNQFGRFVWVEGNTLNIQSAQFLSTGTVITVEYVPNGTARLHNGVCTVNADGDEVTLAATPTVGALDTRDNAYAGCVLRILSVSGDSPTGNYIQERVISSYDRTTRVATLEMALSPVPAAGDGGYIYYEICPSIHIGMDMILALYAARMIATVEGHTKRAKDLVELYREQIRNLRLTAYYTVLPEAMTVRNDSHDNRRYRSIDR